MPSSPADFKESDLRRELDRIDALGVPMAGDDEQMVVIRAIARANVKSMQSLVEVLGQLRTLSAATSECQDTHLLAKKLHTNLGFDGTGDSSIVVRVRDMERAHEGWRGTLAKIAWPIFTALTLGASALAWNSAVDALAASRAAARAVEVTKTAPAAHP